MIYFRDSLFITIFLIINTIIVQGMLSCTMQTPQWVEKVTGYMGSNRVGQLFLTEHLVRSVNHSNFNLLHLNQVLTNELRVCSEIKEKFYNAN